MDVLVVGATGTVGKPVVGALLADGHRVIGTATRPQGRDAIAALGAEPAVLDSLDRGRAIELAVRLRPEAIVDVSTRIPADGPRRMGHMKPTNRLRTQGTANMLAAARAAGTRRFVKESMMFVYGFGQHQRPLTERDPIGEERERGFRVVTGALANGEEQVAAATRAGHLEGVTMRFGLFHGSTAPSTLAIADLVAKRRLPLLGGGEAIHTWIAIEDAASAVALVVAADYPAPAYNVGDEQPVRFRDYLGEIARLIGAPPPLNVPAWLARPMAGYAARFMSAVETPLSSELLRSDLGWRPSQPTYRDVLAPLELERGS